MMRALWFASVFVVACSPWPAPQSGSRWPQPQDLGTFITEGAPLRDTTVDFIARNERVYVLQVLGPGYAVDLSRVTEPTTTLVEFDPASKVVKQLASAPIEVKALWPSDEARGFIAQSGTQLASYDGSAWSMLPELPSARPEIIYRADRERVFMRAEGKVYVLKSGAWRDLGTNVTRGAGVMALGPWSATGVRVVWTEHGVTQFKACTQTIDTTTLMPIDAAVCKDALPLSTFQGEAINGTVDDFQVPFSNGGASTLVWHFSGGAWTRGAYVGAAHVRATPHSKDLCADWPTSGGPAEVATLVRVSGGKAVEALFQRSFSLYGCIGDERSCAHNLDLVIQGVNRDCTSAWFLADNFVDATRKVYLKRVDLPLHDAVTCTPACATGMVCIASNVNEGVCAIDPVNNSTASAMPASLQLQVAGASGLQLPIVTFSAPGTGAPLSDFTSQLDTQQRTLITGPPNTPVIMTVHLDGHEDRAWAFTMPNENTQANLGTLYLVRGTRLGEPPTGQATPSLATVMVTDAGGALVLPLRGEDGGVTVTQVLGASDGGLALVPLAATDAQASAPTVSPDGHWLLWSDSTGLQVLDLSTQQRSTVASTLSGPWLLPSAAFSGDDSTVAIPRGASSNATVSVVSLSGLPTERSTLTAPGEVSLQLSRDGATLLRHAPAGWQLTNSAGTWTVSTQQFAYLSGDGSRVYTAGGSVGALTLWRQASTMGAVPSQVATGVRSVTVDPEGADALFSTFAATKTTISRVDGVTGVVMIVQAAIPGATNALIQSALWVQDTTTTVFFPFNTAPGRAFAGNHSFALDDRRALLDVGLGLLVTPTSSQSLPPGPGVFGPGSTRRLVPASLSIATLNGNTEVAVKAFAVPNVMAVIDARFTNAPSDGRHSYFAPCAVISVPKTTFSIAPSGGAVTVVSAGAEVYCVR